MKTFFKYLPSLALVGLLWLLHWLPLPLLRAIGAAIGFLLFVCARSRKRIVLINLSLCFPELPERERRRLARHHCIAFAQAFLDRTLLWWASRRRLERLIRFHGADNLPAGKPVILLAPHFLGLDAGGIAISLRYVAFSMYAHQKNPVFDAVLFAGRMRFNAPILLSRQDGLRPAIRALKEGRPFYYLPDMDLGARDAVFVPFFGTPAATVIAMARLARISGAVVVPCVTRMVPDGYEVTLDVPWQNYPSGDDEADTRRMNEYIESQVRTMPEQYYWVHRRFKTRPPGEAKIY